MIIAIATACALSLFTGIAAVLFVLFVYAPPEALWLALLSLAIFCGSGVALILQMLREERVDVPLHPDPDGRPAAVRRADRENDDNPLEPPAPPPRFPAGRFID